MVSGTPCFNQPFRQILIAICLQFHSWDWRLDCTVYPEIWTAGDELLRHTLGVVRASLEDLYF